MLSEANIAEDQVLLVGDAIDDRFEIQFRVDQTDDTTATRRCNQFFRSLRKRGGIWKQMFVKGPTGELVQWYANPDKNPAMVRREILAKKLKLVVEPLIPDKTIFVRKSTGSIMVDRRVLASIFLPDQDSAKITWFHPLREKFQINADTVTKDFELETCTATSCS